MARRNSPPASASAASQAASLAPDASRKIRTVRVRSLSFVALTSTIRLE
jgi:hypothetical protein